MASKVATLFVEIGANIAKFNAGFAQVEKRMVQVGKKMTAIGKSMTRNVTLPILAIGTAALKMGADFDKAMTESLAIMGDLSDAMKIRMAEAAKEMSTKTTFAANKLAEAYFFLASAGMDAAQSIKALPVVAKFAQAGAFDLATATDLLTDAQTALGLSSENATENQKNLIKVADVLVKANTLANASVLQFSESLTNRAAAALVNVNKGMEEGVAVLAAFADKGVKGQKAGMRLAMMLNALDVAARKNKKAWDDAGLSLFDAQGEMLSIGNIISDLEGVLGKLTTEQRAATLAQLGFNIRTKASILTLLGSSEKIKQWTKDLKSAGGTMEAVAEKQLQAFTNQMKLLRNILVNVGIQIGDILMPIIKDLVDNHIKPAVEWFSNLSEGTKKTIIQIAGLVAIMGPLLLVLGKFLIILPLITSSAKKMGFTIAGLKTPLIGVKGVLSKLPAIGIAAFVGWQIGRLIGRVKILGKSIDEHISGTLEKAIEKLGLFKSKAEIAADRAELMAKKQEMLAKASELSGQKITKIIDSFDVLKEHYKKTGDLGSKALNDWAKKATKAEEKITKFKEVTEKLSNAQVKLKESTKAVVDMVKAMTDEIMKATLNEFEYRIWAARQTYKERKALLEEEKADKQVFVILERTLAAELNGIEKDRTQKIKDGWAERGRAVMAGLLKFQEEEKKYLATLAGYTDTRMRFTLKEKDYKIWQVGVWYEAEKQKLWDLYGESEKYHEAILALDEAYAAESEDISKGTASHQMSMIEKIGAAAIIALGQSKLGAIAQAIMSTYAGAAKTIEMLGMPFAIPFVALAIATGLKQVAAIKATSLPSAEKGGWIPKPMPIMAGHGPSGEIVASPSLLARLITREIPRQEGTGGAGVTINVSPAINIAAMDALGVRDFMRNRGIAEIVDAVKAGVMKPEFRDALGVKT